MARFFADNLKQKVTPMFDSLDEQLKFIADKEPTWGGSSSDTNRPDFHGTKSFEEAVSLATYGWPEGLKNMSDALEETTKLVNPYRAEQNYLDVCGGYPNVPAACAGAIENMVNFNEGAIKQKPIIKLLINTTAGACRSQKEITNRGAAILSYVDMLESADFPMEIEAYDMGIACSSLFCSRTIVKPAGGRLDVDRLAFVLSHPSYLRRLGFRMREVYPELKSEFIGGYGPTRNFDEEDLKKLNLGLHVHFPYIENGYQNRRDAIALVKETIIAQIKQQGYELPALTAEGGAATH